MRKNIIPRLMTVSLIFSALLPGGVYAESTKETSALPQAFTDLNVVSNEHIRMIQKAVELGWVQGNQAKHFLPTASLTRQELAVLIARIKELPLEKGASSFKDVPSSIWGASAIEAVKKAGLMSGKGGRTFRPNDTVTREELAVTLVRASDRMPEKETKEKGIEDWEAISEWARPYVRTALENGDLNTAANRFEPKNGVNREQAVISLIQTFSPESRPLTVQDVRKDAIIMNGVSYKAAGEAAGLLNPDNRDALKGALIRFESVGRTVKRVTFLQIGASGHAAAKLAPEFSGNLLFDGHGSAVHGPFVVAGDYVSVQNLRVRGDFTIGKELQNDFHAERLAVEGISYVNGGDDNTVVFQDSQLGSIDVNKPNVRVEALGQTSVGEIAINTNAVITADSSIVLPKVNLNEGAQNVQLNGTVDQLNIIGNQGTALSGAANIAQVTINGSGPIQLNITGKINNLQVSNPLAAVTVGSATQVVSGNTAANVPVAPVSLSPSVSPPAVSSPTPINTAPVNSRPFGTPQLVVGAGTGVIDLPEYFTDQEQSVLKYSASSLSGTIVRASLSNGKLTLLPVKKGLGKLSVTADDQNGLKIMVQIPVTVHAQVPDVSAVAGQDEILDLNTFFENTAIDPLSYASASESQTIATVRQSGSSLTLHPIAAGQTKITVEGRNAFGDKVVQTFKVIVQAAANTAPVIHSIQDQTLQAGQAAWELDLSSFLNDAEGDPLTVQASSSDGAVAAASVTGTQLKVQALSAGTSTITLKASDGQSESDPVTFVVTVQPAQAINQKPTGTPPTDRTLILGGNDVELDLSTVFTDAEGDSLTVQASSSDSAVAAASVTGTQLKVQALSAGTSTITLKASDGQSESDPVTFVVTVQSAASPPITNQAPEVYGTVGNQMLTAGVTNDPEFDLLQVFRDADGSGTMTFSAVSSMPGSVIADVSGTKLTLHPGTSAGTAVVTVTASDDQGQQATYNLNVRNAPLVQNGRVVIHTKQGAVGSVVYDLSALLGVRDVYDIYESASGSSAVSGTRKNPGSQMSFMGPTSGYVWALNGSGQAIVISVVADPQGASEPFFSEYLSGSNGRIAFEVFAAGEPNKQLSGYSIEQVIYMKNTGEYKRTTTPMLPFWSYMVYIGLNNIFYDFFDITSAAYYNEEFALGEDANRSTVALLLKDSTGRVVDMLGDPNGKQQFMGQGGTIVRKPGIYTGSQIYSPDGEWEKYPKDTYAMIGRHTP